ncbi:hypothetical protein [Thaumasiovibrio sp. DFM-14]|uniref:hypothetical protein n=1 Tax=Thaumasiovibrio sp. DFM-14 TaxID=3384792 RepID=UPI00399FFD1A
MWRWILATIFFSQSAIAFNVAPIIAEISPAGAAAQQIYTVGNTRDKEIDVSVTPYYFLLDNGEGEPRIATEEFLIIPDTLTVQPGESHAVLVKYIGDPTKALSVTYRISFEEINNIVDEQDKIIGDKPNSKEDSELDLSFKLRYGAMLSVIPTDAKGNIEVDNVTTNKDGNYVIDITNSGTRFVLLSQTRWSIKTDNTRSTKTYNADKLGEFININYFPPKTSKRLILNKNFDHNISNITSISIE